MEPRMTENSKPPFLEGDVGFSLVVTPKEPQTEPEFHLLQKEAF
jgi:hypothetical protein